MAKHIVSVGDLVLDIILPAQFPIRGGQHQIPADRRTEPGGAANFMIAARNLGADVTAAGAVGADVYGDLILAALRKRRIDVSQVVVTPGSTTTLVITLTDRESGEHVFLGHYGEGPELTYPKKLDAKIDKADAVFLSGYTLVEQRLAPMVIRAVNRAQQRRKPVYLDVGPLLTAADPERVKWALARTHALFLTEEEVPLVTPGLSYQEAYAELLLQGPEFAVVKRGPQGCVLVTRDEWIEVPAFEVEQVVDTVGAGDTFDAAFMVGMLNGLEMRESALLANAMGAANTYKVGAGTNAPTCAEVMAVLGRAGVAISFSC
jgi:ribokinase